MKSRKLDLAEQLKFLGAQTELISGAFGTGDSKFISHALGTTARAFGMTDPSSESGGPHEALYRALRECDDPRCALCHAQPSQLTRPARPGTADRGICGQYRALPNSGKDAWSRSSPKATGPFETAIPSNPRCTIGRSHPPAGTRSTVNRVPVKPLPESRRHQPLVISQACSAMVGV